MKGFGSGDCGEFTFLDYINIIAFWIAIQNYDMNLTQDDKQDLMESLTNKSQELLKEIHGHLEEQDRKLDLILEELHGNNQAS